MASLTKLVNREISTVPRRSSPLADRRASVDAIKPYSRSRSLSSASSRAGSSGPEPLIDRPGGRQPDDMRVLMRAAVKRWFTPLAVANPIFELRNKDSGTPMLMALVVGFAAVLDTRQPADPPVDGQKLLATAQASLTRLASPRDVDCAQTSVILALLQAFGAFACPVDLRAQAGQILRSVHHPRLVRAAQELFGAYGVRLGGLTHPAGLDGEQTTVRACSLLSVLAQIFERQVKLRCLPVLPFDAVRSGHSLLSLARSSFMHDPRGTFRGLVFAALAQPFVKEDDASGLIQVAEAVLLGRSLVPDDASIVKFILPTRNLLYARLKACEQQVKESDQARRTSALNGLRCIE